MRASALWPAAEPRLRAAAGAVATALHELCNLDVTADIDGLWVGLRHLATERPDAVLVVRGIDRERGLSCAQAAAAAGIDVTTERGVIVVRGVHGAVVFAGTFVDATTAVIEVGDTSTAASLRALVARPSTARLTADTTAPMWMIARGDARILDLANLGTRPREVNGEVRLVGGISVTASVHFTAPVAAHAFARAARSKLVDSAALFDHVEARVAGADAMMEVDATVEQSTRLLEQMIALP